MELLEFVLEIVQGYREGPKKIQVSRKLVKALLSAQFPRTHAQDPRHMPALSQEQVLRQVYKGPELLEKLRLVHISQRSLSAATKQKRDGEAARPKQDENERTTEATEPSHGAEQ